MAPYFEFEKGPDSLKGVRWYPHQTNGSNAEQCHTAIESLAKQENAFFKEVKDEQGNPCPRRPKRYGPEGPIVKSRKPKKSAQKGGA